MNDAIERAAELAFGVRTLDLKDAARRSPRVYVRGLDALAEDDPKATGRRMNALEALRAYGIDVLVEVAVEGYCRLAPSAEAAGRVLLRRREQLGLEQRHVASRANLPISMVVAAEQSKRLPLREYEKIARVLGLDERYVSVHAEPQGNERIAVRLRTIGDENPRLGPGTVSALAEAAWVAMTQIRLEEDLRLTSRVGEFEHNQNYGGPGSPAYSLGYQLAADARAKLGAGAEPITSMRGVAEYLGVPVIQAELGDSLAGVTIEVASRRAIVVNLEGKNRHVYVRRATLAHELGHLLYDPPRRLNDLRVDEYDALDQPVEQLRDPVEQRANAFAVELLAPQSAAVRCYQETQDDPIGEVMDRFGISYTAARRQVWNGLRQAVAYDDLTSDRREPPKDWEAREAYTVDYHPIRGLRPTRAGRFSAVVGRAASEQLIPWDTAAAWLETTATEAQRVLPQIRELFPAVWQ